MDPFGRTALLRRRRSALLAARDGAAAVFQAAIVDNDAASQESLAQVADGLTERLRGRLTDAGLPAFLAPRLPLPRGWRKD